MHKVSKITVFTDLDGSFLDHNNYSYSAALPALSRLKDINAEIIPTTSKTLAEIKALNLPFGSSPQIAENGMVVFDGKEKQSRGKNYQDIISFIDALPREIRRHIRGFNDMNVEDVALQTFLTNEQAKLAKSRLGSEPFMWLGDDTKIETLGHLSEQAGYSMTRGGRFYHIMGAQGGKAAAIDSFLKDKKGLITIALGDGPNDAEMLAAVDYGIKIPNAKGQDFDVKSPKGEIINAPKQGPEGWNDAINALLDRLRF